VCAACHGRNLQGSALEGTPSLAIVGAYSEAQFRQLLRSATAANGRDVERMSWVREVQFTDQEINDLLAFLKEHDGQQVAGNDGSRTVRLRESQILPSIYAM
jgi:cytochrome c553